MKRNKKIAMWVLIAFFSGFTIAACFALAGVVRMCIGDGFVTTVLTWGSVPLAGFLAREIYLFFVEVVFAGEDWF